MFSDAFITIWAQAKLHGSSEVHILFWFPPPPPPVNAKEIGRHGWNIKTQFHPMCKYLLILDHWMKKEWILPPPPLVKYDMSKIRIFPYKALLVYLRWLQNFALLSLIPSYLKLLNVYFSYLEVCYVKNGTKSKDSISVTHSEFKLKWNNEIANLQHPTISEEKKERRLKRFPKPKLTT